MSGLHFIVITPGSMGLFWGIEQPHFYVNEGNISSVLPSNFLPRLDEEQCTGCESCIGSCHIYALSPGQNGEPLLDEEKCIGCGVCVSVCPSGALQLQRKKPLYEIPKDKKEQLRQIAAEKGKL